MWLDDAFLQAKGENTAQSTHIIDQTGEQTILTITRVINEGIPAIARTFLGESITLVETQTWGHPVDGVRNATVGLTVRNAPATVTGTISLNPIATGTLVSIHFDIKVAVPLFGATAESVIKEQLERFIRAEQVIGNAWLASHQ